MPLINKEHFAATLTASSPATGTFCSHKLDILAIFAEQAVLAISSARRAELAQQDAARMKANFLSLITHELRSPLNTINGHLDLSIACLAGELPAQQPYLLHRAHCCA